MHEIPDRRLTHRIVSRNFTNCYLFLARKQLTIKKENQFYELFLILNNYLNYYNMTGSISIVDNFRRNAKHNDNLLQQLNDNVFSI